MAPQHQKQLHAVVVQQRGFKGLIQGRPVAGICPAQLGLDELFRPHRIGHIGVVIPQMLRQVVLRLQGRPQHHPVQIGQQVAFREQAGVFRPGESRLHQGVVPVHAVRLPAALFCQLHAVAAPAAERARLFVTAGQRRDQMDGVHAPTLRQGQQLYGLQRRQFRGAALYQSGKLLIRSPQHQIPLHIGVPLCPQVVHGQQQGLFPRLTGVFLRQLLYLGDSVQEAFPVIRRSRIRGQPQAERQPGEQGKQN